MTIRAGRCAVIQSVVRKRMYMRMHEEEEGAGRGGGEEEGGGRGGGTL